MENNRQRLNKKLISAFLLIVMTLGGFYFGLHLGKKQAASQTSGNFHSIREGGYQLINPLLECEFSQALENKNLVNLKSGTNDLIKKILKDGQASHFSVYYRDLNNGPWFGINEQENFRPASLLKVPIMIAYLKKAESDPEVLAQTIVFNPEESPLLSLPETENDLKPNEIYTVLELIEKMIIYSDNNAFNLLTRRIDEKTINKIHLDLGLAFPTNETPDNFISVKSYASLFRILFNASYLNREMSEMALEILTRTSFKKGLVNRLPTETMVAHKFGIWSAEESEQKQLHDCGIIYAPDNPYLLCLMTRGENFDELSSALAEVSLSIFNEIQK